MRSVRRLVCLQLHSSALAELTTRLEQSTASGKKVQARALAMDFSKLEGPQWNAFKTEVENLDVGVLGASNL